MQIPLRFKCIFTLTYIKYESACNAGDLGLIPGSGRSPGERNGCHLQYSCLENPMDRGAWQDTPSSCSEPFPAALGPGAIWYPGRRAQLLYLLAGQGHHVEGPVHEPPHQDLGAVFGSYHVVGPVVGSDVLEGQKPVQPLQGDLTLLLICIVLRMGWRMVPCEILPFFLINPIKVSKTCPHRTPEENRPLKTSHHLQGVLDSHK